MCGGMAGRQSWPSDGAEQLAAVFVDLILSLVWQAVLAAEGGLLPSAICCRLLCHAASLLFFYGSAALQLCGSCSFRGGESCMFKRRSSGRCDSITRWPRRRETALSRNKLVPVPMAKGPTSPASSFDALLNCPDAL